MISVGIVSAISLAACTSSKVNPSHVSPVVLPTTSDTLAVDADVSHVLDPQPAITAAKPLPTPEKKISRPAVVSKIPVVGWIEKVQVDGAKLPLKAKLDTGAHTSSIDAHIIKIFKKDGDKKDWVVYRVSMDSGKNVTFEDRVTRWVRIKTKTGKFIRRPVVMMHFCIGSVAIEGEVNLADRSHFIYPILIGRNMIKNHLIIDVTKTFTTVPQCKVK